jgi:hypothetical protein
MKDYKSLQKALEEISRWGEDYGARWCREHARQTLESIKKYPDKLHESHKAVRSSDVSTFDFICDDCGATDDVTSGWGGLRKPCNSPVLETNPGPGNLCCESVSVDSDGYIIWNGGADRPIPDDAIVQVKIRSGLYRSPIDALYWPQICWRHRSKDDPKNCWDIIAYKVIENDDRT